MKKVKFLFTFLFALFSLAVFAQEEEQKEEEPQQGILIRISLDNFIRSFLHLTNIEPLLELRVLLTIKTQQTTR